MTVEFKFELGEEVTTPNGQLGVVLNCSISSLTGKEVLVEDFSGRSYWWPEGKTKKKAEEAMKETDNVESEALETRENET